MSLKSGRRFEELGWMTPRAYASALGGENGRTLRFARAPRPDLLPHRKQKVQINLRPLAAKPDAIAEIGETFDALYEYHTTKVEIITPEPKPYGRSKSLAMGRSKFPIISEPSLVK
jgi:hypothetical protein